MGSSVVVMSKDGVDVVEEDIVIVCPRRACLGFVVMMKVAVVWVLEVTFPCSLFSEGGKATKLDSYTKVSR